MAGAGKPFVYSLLVTGVDAKTAATTTIATLDDRVSFLGVIVTCETASSISVGPTLSVGSSAGIDNIIPPTALTGLISANGSLWLPCSSTVSVAANLPPTSIVSVKISTIATGTAQTISVSVIAVASA